MVGTGFLAAAPDAMRPTGPGGVPCRDIRLGPQHEAGEQTPAIVAPLPSERSASSSVPIWDTPVLKAAVMLIDVPPEAPTIKGFDRKDHDMQENHTDQPRRLEGKVAIVTGAGSGIGAAIAGALHKEGARVVVADISGAEQPVAADLGDRATAISIDVASEASVKALVTTTVERFGRLDVMCNNAGLSGAIAPTADSSVENWERIFAVNARGAYLGCHYAVPAMLSTGGGSIINTASVSGLVAFPGLPAYGASKGAVVQLTKTVAAEYGRAGIRCNAICPGIIATPMLDSVKVDAPDAFAQLSTLAEQATAVGRLGEPSEIAAAAVFLASDESSFVTGVALPVDGGYTAT